MVNSGDNSSHAATINNPTQTGGLTRATSANGKHFHIWTIGCQMNEADSAKIAATLQEAGYAATSDEQDADIVILNSCVVRQAAEDKVAGKLNSLIRLKRERPDVSVVLTGCMVTNQQERLRERFPHVDLFFDPSDFAQLEKVAPGTVRLERRSRRAAALLR